MKPPPLDQPLEQITSLKLKLSVVIGAAVAVTVVVSYAGTHLGLWPSVSGVIAAALAILAVRYLARGTTRPLRQMSEAAEAMTHGDFSRRVEASTRDEVGRLAVAFNQMADVIAETDQLRRDLVANVSHELRTPIAALQAQLENLVDGVEPADPAHLREMLAQVERLGRLVSQLLDLSRLEAGTAPIERRRFELSPMLEAAVREARMTANDVAIAVHVAPNGLALHGDAERLHQVVANLVENAVRHSPRGGTVRVGAVAAVGAVVIDVSDDGPGINDAEAERIFERFYRADRARSSTQGGAGLGLAIAKWIVDLHGGDIHPERREPHGCRMVVTIPTSEAPAPSNSEHPAPAPVG